MKTISVTDTTKGYIYFNWMDRMDSLTEFIGFFLQIYVYLGWYKFLFHIRAIILLSKCKVIDIQSGL